MVSSDEISRKLKNKREGIDSGGLKCSECGTENPKDSGYCQECGAVLKPVKVESTDKAKNKFEFIDKHPTLGKIPGFRSKTGWKMIIGTVGYFLIALIIVFGILSAVINTDVAFNVNSAVYTNNIAGYTGNSFSNSSSNFLIMNVSVKNNGNGKTTINPNEFSLLSNNESTNSQPYIGNTSIESIDLAPGENKSMVIAFSLNGNTSNTLKYSSFWDPTSNGITANIGKIANNTPFDGQYSTYDTKGNIIYSGGSQSYDKNTNVTYNYLNQPFTSDLSSRITSLNGTSFDFPINTSTTYNQSIQEFTNVKLISPSSSTIYVTNSIYITLNTGTSTKMMSPNLHDETGLYSAYYIINRAALSSIGDSIPIVDSNGNTDGTEKLVRSEIIEIAGKKIDCWVTESNSNSTGEKDTNYYDKTTGLLIKQISNKNLSGYGQTATENEEQTLIATNVPLIGIK